MVSIIMDIIIMSTFSLLITRCDSVHRGDITWLCELTCMNQSRAGRAARLADCQWASGGPTL